MLRHDRISMLMIVLAMMGVVYTATWAEPETLASFLFPGILLCFGLVMEVYLERQREYVSDAETYEMGMKKILPYVIIALIGVFLTGFAIANKESPGYQILNDIRFLIAYGVFMAVAEEQFFRGFILDAILQKIPNIMPFMGVLFSAGIFTVYHQARYGGNPDAMLYVFAGGVILSWVAWKSRRLSPVMIAHVINNVLAEIGVFG